MRDLLASKKFRVFIVGVICVVANDLFEIGVSPEAVDHFVVLVLGFVGSQGIADWAKEKAKIENGRTGT